MAEVDSSAADSDSQQDDPDRSDKRSDGEYMFEKSQKAGKKGVIEADEFVVEAEELAGATAASVALASLVKSKSKDRYRKAGFGDQIFNLATMEKNFVGIVRLSEGNLRDVKDLGLEAMFEILLTHPIIDTFIFSLFDKNRIYAFAKKVRAVYSDPRIEKISIPYIVQTPLVAESKKLIELVNWGLKLNGSSLSVVFRVALEIDNEISF